MISPGINPAPPPPLFVKGPLKPRAQQLVDESFRDIPAGKQVDYHTHILTLDKKKTDGYVNPGLLTWRHPIKRLKTYFYMRASLITDLAKAGTQYLDRLVKLIRAIPHHGKHYLLAFDQHYDRDGTARPEKTEFYVSNEYVWKVAQRYPDLFIPAISIHPYRKDALQELDRWGKLGVKLIKWLPNAQGMDASDSRLDSYYKKVREYGMTILTHVGEEQAVHAKEDQRLGNPLLFRRPLEQGVKIMMAHGGSLGVCEDFDYPKQRKIPCYELVLRLMRQPKYQKQLSADISAMTQSNRVPKPLIAFLAATDVHNRLVNGSDYPLPAVNLVISLEKLANYRLINRVDVIPLREIFYHNPLLFDFVLKRRLKHPETGQRFPANVFIGKNDSN